MAIPTPLKRVKDFEDLGFGMFVHWGLYSQLGVGEWTYWTHKRDMNEYKLLKDSFTAEDFSAEDLVLTAKRAGCKYITLTTRHHEGFSLYDTCGLSDFDAPHSPAGRDLIRSRVPFPGQHAVHISQGRGLITFLRQGPSAPSPESFASSASWHLRRFSSGPQASGPGPASKPKRPGSDRSPGGA